mmetsp:Transcript_43881/g.81599  ORF Transcript_43881/g.81599 Transcript_43881/m.81599 type:complete len:401 (-) Transcript_43881:95-1297(-)
MSSHGRERQRDVRVEVVELVGSVAEPVAEDHGEGRHVGREVRGCILDDGVLEEVVEGVAELGTVRRGVVASALDPRIVEARPEGVAQVPDGVRPDEGRGLLGREAVLIHHLGADLFPGSAAPAGDGTAGGGEAEAGKVVRPGDVAAGLVGAAPLEGVELGDLGGVEDAVARAALTDCDEEAGELDDVGRGDINAGQGMSLPVVPDSLEVGHGEVEEGVLGLEEHGGMVHEAAVGPAHGGALIERAGIVEGGTEELACPLGIAADDEIEHGDEDIELALGGNDLGGVARARGRGYGRGCGWSRCGFSGIGRLGRFARTAAGAHASVRIDNAVRFTVVVRDALASTSASVRAILKRSLKVGMQASRGCMKGCDGDEGGDGEFHLGLRACLEQCWRFEIVCGR